MFNPPATNTVEILVAIFYMIGTWGGILLIKLIKEKGYINKARTINETVSFAEIIIVMYNLERHRKDLTQDKSMAFAWKLAKSTTAFFERLTYLDYQEEYTMIMTTISNICKIMRYFPTVEEKKVIEDFVKEATIMKQYNKKNIEPNESSK